MKFIISLLVGFAAALPNLAAAQEKWQPTANVELIVGAEPGGAADRFGRIVQRALQEEKLVPTTMTVLNKPGQGQRVGIAYLNQHEGDGNYLILVSASTVTSAILGGQPPLQDELTPIAKLVDNDIVMSVKADSEIKTAKDIVDRLKADVNSVSFTFSTSAGNTIHIAISRFATLAGVEPSKLRIVVNNSGAVCATQVAGGHVDIALTSSGSAKPLVDAGELRMIGTVSKSRLPSLPDLPTIEEQGYDILPSIGFWYQIFGPKGMTPEQTAFWADALKKTLDSKEMNEFLVNNNWTKDYLADPELTKALVSEWQILTDALVSIGLIAK